jgi:hypothetical protein
MRTQKEARVELTKNLSEKERKRLRVIRVKGAKSVGEKTGEKKRPERPTVLDKSPLKLS